MKKRELADLLGLDGTTVGKWVSMGLPQKDDWTPQEVIQFLYKRWKDKVSPEEQETKRLIELEDLRKKKLANDQTEGFLIDKEETEAIISRNLSILSSNLTAIPERECARFHLPKAIEESFSNAIKVALEGSVRLMVDDEIEDSQDGE